MKYEYINVSAGETYPEDAVEFGTSGVLHIEELVQEAGLEEVAYLGPNAVWPMDLEVFSDGRRLGAWQVERIEQPGFLVVSCTEIEEVAL